MPSDAGAVVAGVGAVVADAGAVVAGVGAVVADAGAVVAVGAVLGVHCPLGTLMVPEPARAWGVGVRGRAWGPARGRAWG